MLKRVLSLVLVGVMAISLFACGEKHMCDHCMEYKVCTRYKMRDTDTGNVGYANVCKKCYKEWSEGLFANFKIEGVVKD